MGLFSKLFAKPAQSPVDPVLEGKRVLVVDPSITITKVIELTLGEGVVSTAATMQEATAVAANEHPDLVIASVVLPDGDGYQLCAMLRPCPVILLRGAFETFDEGKAKLAGARAVMSKPFQPAELLDAVREALSR
ncbi:MAG TPA: response regulator [Thermoanaerobaculia bacterium]|nr:response regulator [Thermoanaerobaculia bacterium]